MDAPDDAAESDRDSRPAVGTSYMTLTVGDREVDFGHEVFDYSQREDCIVVLLDVHSGKHELQPVVEDRTRNVVAVDYDGNHLWRIPAPPHEFPADEYRRDDAEDERYHAGSHYRLLLEIGDTVQVRHTNKHRYELDPETGRLVDHAPDNSLVIGGRERRFRAPVKEVLERDGKTVVLLQAWDRSYLSYDPDDELDTDDVVYCFDGEGDLAWRKSGGYLGMHYDEERDGVWLVPDPRLGNRDLVDLDTGI